MTEQEAQGWIEDIPHNGLLQNEIEAIEIASKALEKQIPVAPDVYEAHPYPLYMCRVCGSTFVRNQFGNEMKYCPECGQKQEWIK